MPVNTGRQRARKTAAIKQGNMVTLAHVPPTQSWHWTELRKFTKQFSSWLFENVCHQTVVSSKAFLLWTCLKYSSQSFFFFSTKLCGLISSSLVWAWHFILQNSDCCRVLVFHLSYVLQKVSSFDLEDKLLLQWGQTLEGKKI